METSRVLGSDPQRKPLAKILTTVFASLGYCRGRGPRFPSAKTISELKLIVDVIADAYKQEILTAPTATVR
jgi:hypothetical protein